MRLIEVNSGATRDKFLKLGRSIYQDDPNYVEPLHSDVEAVFDSSRNRLLSKGEACRWILERDGIVIGRVAVFINPKTRDAGEVPTGGLGFYECIDDLEAAFVLFNACKEWLEARGIEAMDGPINFGERDRFWGLLVEGFTEPTYTMNYHKPYYKQQFEAFGFKTFFEQFVFGRDVHAPLPEKVAVKAAAIAQDPGYSFSHINKKKLEPYIEQFREVYNKAWAGFGEFKEMSSGQAAKVINKLKPVMDDELIWFAYYNGQPVAFFIMIPDMNQVFRHLNGKLNLIGKLKFLYHKWRGTCNRICGLAFGITPDHQGKGLEGAIVDAAAAVIQRSGQYKTMELNWIGSFNPKMLHVVEGMGTKRIKKLITYRKLFDEQREFNPAPILD